MKILIQGGGIAGLSLAAALNQEGIYPVVIEKAHAFGYVGFWVYIYNNGRKMLHRLGVEEELNKVGYVVPGYQVLNNRDEPIHYLDFDGLGPNYIAATSVERPALHGILQKLVDKKSAIRFGTSITSFNNGPDGVEVELSDGSKDTYDLVVAADGMHSQLRSQVFPEVREKPYGMHAWIYVINSSQIPIPKEIVHRISAGAYAVLYPHGKDRCALYLAAHAEPDKYTPENDGRADIPKMFSHFGSPISDLMDFVSNNAPAFHDDIERIENKESYKERIVLIGDAEHAMSPLIGQGSSLAMEDAVVLADELIASGKNIDLALENYHQRRQTRVKEIQRLSNQLMLWMEINNPLEEEIVQQLVKHFVPPSMLLNIVVNRIEKTI